MSHYLPPCVYAFFEAPTIRFQATKHSLRSKARKYDPIAPLLDHLSPLPPPSTPSTHEQKQLEIAEREELHATTIAAQREEYDRKAEPLAPDCQLTEDPELTLFIGRLSYKVDATILEEEMKRYGTIISCRVVHDPLGEPGPDGLQKSLGYGFVQYSTKSECEQAYINADGAEILGRHIVVDWERRRTDPNWFPRRLHGGEGTTRHHDKSQVCRAPGRTSSYLALREERRRRAEQHEMEQRARAGEFQGRGGRGGFRGRGGGHGNWNDRRDDRHNDRRDFDRRDDRGGRDFDRDRGRAGGFEGGRGGFERRDDGNRAFDRRDERDRDRQYGSGFRGGSNW